MSAIVAFFAGLFVGAWIGVFLMALVIAAHDREE